MSNAVARPRLVVPPATLALSLALLVIYCVARSHAAVVRALAVESTPLGAGEVWRLAAALFVHANAIHLVSNLSSLLIVGSLVERRAGTAIALLVFFASGVVGSLASLTLGSLGSGIGYGASGAVMGLLGAATFHVRSNDVLSRTTLVAWATAVFLSAAFLPVDGTAHFAGWLTGLTLAPIFHRLKRS